MKIYQSVSVEVNKVNKMGLRWFVISGYATTWKRWEKCVQLKNREDRDTEKKTLGNTNDNNPKTDSQCFTEDTESNTANE